MRRSKDVLDVLCTFNLGPVSTGKTKRNNKLCLGKIYRHKTVRTKFSMDSGFSNDLYGKKGKPRNAENQQKTF